MTAKFTKSYKEALLKRLKNYDEAVAYLNAALKDGAADGVLLALRDVIEARGGGVGLPPEKAKGSKGTKKSAQSDKRVVQLKITLQETKPVVWRRIQVPASMTFRALADAVISAVGFLGEHLYLFKVGAERIGNKEFDDLDDWTSDTRLRVGQVVDQGVKSFFLEYDFGDGWRHKIEVEDILSPDPAERYPVCVGGKNAGPPEDCGGPWGFEEFKGKIADPAHPEHQETLEWLGRPYDPKSFDLMRANFCFTKRAKIKLA